MGFLKVLLVAIEFFTAILLIAVILVQKSKDEGLGLAFGAGVGESLFGSRAGNVLTKITIILTLVFLLNTLFLGMISSKSKERSVVDRLPDQPMNTQPLLPTTTPVTPENSPVESPAPYVPAEMPATPASESAPMAPVAAPVPAP
jgi:preprotein translocase subunit SecG